MVYPVSYNDYAKKTPLLDRFIRYALIPTGSDPESAASPSAAREFDLARVLESELRALGAKDVTLSEKGVVTATIPASSGAEKAPVILLNSHMDTSPEASCEGIHPQVAEAWNGEAIALDPENKIRLDPEVFPELRRHIGEDIICTDGRTLLGADDKAGVAAIMNAAEWFLTHPEDPHAEIRILFTPDEEIGRGTDSVDVPGLRASYGFTIDGGDVGRLESETFNAATARVTFTGISVHPGSAKGKMVNAAKLAARFISLLPESESPEETEGHEGFFHPISISGGVEHAEVILIIRDHDRGAFEDRKMWLAALVQNFDTGRAAPAQVVIQDQYRNMRDYLAGHENILDLAHAAYRDCGIEPIEEPVRGGTDGAFFSAKGLPCPNVFTGGLNYHGIYECIPAQSLEKAANAVIAILRRSASLTLNS